MQVLEGDAQSVASAAYRIRRDNQFERCSTIVNCEIDSPYFNNWLIRIIKPEAKTLQPFLVKLKKELEKDFAFESPKDRKLFEELFLAECTGGDSQPSPVTAAAAPPVSAENNPPANASVDFSSSSLSLWRWPKPTQVKLTPQAMKTCSLISHQFIPYRHLFAKNIWKSEVDLIDFLNTLNQAGVLRVQACEAASGAGAVRSAKVEVSHSKPEASSGKKDRFSQLLRKFIGSPKRKVD